MLTLEQVKLLDSKVESLIEMVRSLTAEKEALCENIQKKEAYIRELENKVESYEAEQAKIEECVGNTLDQLNVLHNFASHTKVASSSTVQDEGNATYQADSVERHEALSEDSPTSSSQPALQTFSETLQDGAEVDDSKAEKDMKPESSDEQMDIF